jgi:hypothetical protein
LSVGGCAKREQKNACDKQFREFGGHKIVEKSELKMGRSKQAA